MNILLISNNDMCRSRMAQAILGELGTGMKIYTAGILAGNSIPDVVCTVMEQNGYSVLRKKPCGAENYTSQPWDYVVTLCKEVEEELKYLNLDATRTVCLEFDDPLADGFQDESQQELKVGELYELMRRRLYEFYRDELSEQLLPRCTCGANTYCRCE